MNDFIGGNVKNVIDGDTVELKVTRIGGNENIQYGEEEKIRIKEIKPLLWVEQNGHGRKPFIEMILLGKDVTCLVSNRNREGFIEGVLFLL